MSFLLLNSAFITFHETLINEPWNSGRLNRVTFYSLFSVDRDNHRALSSKNSKANRIETGERSGGIGEICSVEVDEK